MRISGTEPSSVILSLTKYFKHLKNDAKNKPGFKDHLSNATSDHLKCPHSVYLTWVKRPKLKIHIAMFVYTASLMALFVYTKSLIALFVCTAS